MVNNKSVTMKRNDTMNSAYDRK